MTNEAAGNQTYADGDDKCPCHCFYDAVNDEVHMLITVVLIYKMSRLNLQAEVARGKRDRTDTPFRR